MAPQNGNNGQQNEQQGQQNGQQNGQQQGQQNGQQQGQQQGQQNGQQQGQQNGEQQGQQNGEQQGQQNGEQQGQQQGQQNGQQQGQQNGQQNGQQQGQQNGQQQGQQNGQQNGQQGQQGQQNQGQQQGQDQGQQQGQQGQQGQQNQGQQQGQDQGQQQGQQGQQGQGQQDQGQQNQGQQGQGNNQNGQQSGHDNNDNNNNNDNNRGGDRNGHQSGDNNRDQHRDGNNRSGGGESGLSTSTSVIIASSVSVVSTLLLVILAIWLWRRRQKKRKWSNLTGSNSKGFHEKRPISQPTDRRPISPPADRPPIPPSLAISTPVTALPKYTPPEEPSPVSPVSPEPPARNSCYGFAKSKPVPRNKPGSPGERRAASIAWKSSNPPYVAPKDVSGVGLRSAASLERSPSPPQPAHLPNGRRSRAGLEYNKTDGDYDEDDVEVARAVRSTPQMTVTPPDTSPADQRVQLDNLGSSHTVVGDPGRWSWTNSQAPSTPRIPAPSPQGSVSNIRAVAAWFRGGGRSTNDNEKNFSLPDRGGSKPLLKNHAQRPVLAPTQFVQQEIPSPARPRVSDVFRSSIPSTPTTASSSSREGGVTLSGDRRLT